MLFERNMPLVSKDTLVSKELYKEYNPKKVRVLEGPLNTGYASFILAVDEEGKAEIHLGKGNVLGFIAGDTIVAQLYLLAALILDDAHFRYNRELLDLTKVFKGLEVYNIKNMAVIDLDCIERYYGKKEDVFLFENVKVNEISYSEIPYNYKKLATYYPSFKYFILQDKKDLVGYAEYHKASHSITFIEYEKGKQKSIINLIKHLEKSDSRILWINSFFKSYTVLDELGRGGFLTPYEGDIVTRNDYRYGDYIRERNLCCFFEIEDYRRFKYHFEDALSVPSKKEEFLRLTESYTLRDKKYKEYLRACKNLMLTGMEDKDARESHGIDELAKIYSKYNFENPYDLLQKLGYFPGHVLTIKTRGRSGSDMFLKIPNKINGRYFSTSLFHTVVVYEGKVYDPKYKFKPIDFEEYIAMFNKINSSGIRADKTLSSMTFGLPISRDK